jgi:prefoldin subunit 5
MTDNVPYRDGDGPGWRDRVDRLTDWRRDLTAEVIELPATIADLRRTISDLRKVSERLEKATAGLEILLRHAEQSGLTDAARRLDEAATLVQSQVAAVRDQTPGSELFEATVSEIQKSVASMADLFPGMKPGEVGKKPPRRTR